MSHVNRDTVILKIYCHYKHNSIKILILYQISTKYLSVTKNIIKNELKFFDMPFCHGITKDFQILGSTNREVDEFNMEAWEKSRF